MRSLIALGVASYLLSSSPAAQEALKSLAVFCFEKIVAAARELRLRRALNGDVTLLEALPELELQRVERLCDTIKQRVEDVRRARAEHARAVQEMERETERKACKICLDRSAGVAFNPCGHIVSCDTCSTRLRECPMCRQRIVSRLRVYHS
eukprot:tig00021326_g20307.t1